jgi:hypothetical protein
LKINPMPAEVNIFFIDSRKYFSIKWELFLLTQDAPECSLDPCHFLPKGESYLQYPIFHTFTSHSIFS